MPGAPGFYATPDDPLVSPDFSGWWTRSFRLLKLVWWQSALLQLIWVLPLSIETALGGSVMQKVFSGPFDANQDFQPDWHPLVRSLAYLVPLGLVTGLLTMLASLSMLHLVVQAALGRPLSVGLALRTAAVRLPAYLGWGLVAVLLCVAGLFFCIVPGIYVSIVMTILPVVVLLERGGAVARCFQLFHARPGDALARLIAMLGISMVASFVAQMVTGMLSPPSGLVTADGFSWTGFAVVWALLLVFNAAVQVVLAPMHVTTYADMRARHEPFSTAYLTSN